MTTLMRIRPSAGRSPEFYEFRRAYCNAQRRARYASKRGLRERPVPVERRNDGPFGPDCVRWLHVVRALGTRGTTYTQHACYLRVHMFRRNTGVRYVRPASVTLIKLANAACSTGW